jgi:hypothetical protein
VWLLGGDALSLADEVRRIAVRRIAYRHILGGVYLVYMDDSGDPGVHPGSPTETYTIACVFVRDTDWVPLFEDLIRFRRYLRANFGLRMRQEIKANQLVQGTGPWLTLGFGDRARKRVYRSFMRLQGSTGTVKTFAVVIDKSQCASADDVREKAWRHALERVEAFARHNKTTLMLIPDSGEYDRFRKLARKMRRFSQVGAMVGGGTLSRPLATFLIDDPVERDSAQSYFVQLADLNAYAAYRKERPDPLFPPNMWEQLGPAILIEANQYHLTEHPGIVRGPR